jgi:ABC-2 type transport system ATP-binding protein
VGLTEQADAYARNLSGGMKRRLLLAKALVHRPAVLVLDEPTAGVDIELRNMLWANVRKLNEQGMTIILTTHYLEEAEAMCDEIAIINHGELIVRDTTAKLLARMDGKTLVVEPAGQIPASFALPEGVTMETRPDGRLAFTYHRTQTSAGAILDTIRAAGVEVRDVASEQPGLEEVFVALTSKT